MAAIAAGVGCGGTPPPRRDPDAEARAQIAAAIARSADATRNKDIDAFMAGIPEDLALHGDTGFVLTKDQLRANVVRDWSIVPRTLSIRYVVDSCLVHGDSATVFTSQRWERLMLERDGRTIDTVLTTQRHREIWRHTVRGWFPYDVRELGGEAWVNGKAVPD